MGKRVVAVVVAALVAGTLGVGAALVAGRSARRAPAALPALPGSAKAWTLDDQVTRAEVAALATRLGLAGEPRLTGSTWTVSDGSRRLFVNRLPGVPWSFSRTRLVCGGPVPGGVTPKGAACASIEPQLEGVPPDQPSPAASAPRLEPPRPVELPDRSQAERVARALLGRVGAPLQGAELLALKELDRWFVSVSPPVGGLPTTERDWTVSVGPKGQVLAAGGWLATPQAAGTYPLISVRQALDRLRSRPVSGPITEPAPGRLARPAPCGPPSGQQPSRCAPPRRVVTGARLGLELATVLPQGAGGGREPLSYLVPAYFFQIDGSWTRQVAVVAVQDRFLTTPPATVVPLHPG